MPITTNYDDFVDRYYESHKEEHKKKFMNNFVKIQKEWLEDFKEFSEEEGTDENFCLSQFVQEMTHGDYLDRFIIYDDFVDRYYESHKEEHKKKFMNEFVADWGACEWLAHDDDIIKDILEDRQEHYDEEYLRGTYYVFYKNRK
jgi:hypothetical protein